MGVEEDKDEAMEKKHERKVENAPSPGGRVGAKGMPYFLRSLRKKICLLFPLMVSLSGFSN